MRRCCLVLMAIAHIGRPACAQIQDAGSSEIRKQWVLGEHLAWDLDQQVGRVEDVPLIDYLQRIENRITNAIGANPLQIRVTRSPDQSASLLPNGILYLSIGMLARIETESELAGLLAHELAHSQRGTHASARSAGGDIRLPSCVLTSPLAPMTWGDQMRDEEVRATVEAVRSMKVAGYDPLSAVEFLSKVAFENPRYGKAILSEDLLDLRGSLELESPPLAGYVLDSSEFVEQRARITLALNHPPARTRSPILTSPRRP